VYTSGVYICRFDYNPNAPSKTSKYNCLVDDIVTGSGNCYSFSGKRYKSSEVNKCIAITTDL